jgi:hypothetical protein
MTTGQLINLSGKKNLINTSDAYSLDSFLFGDNLLMPTVNLDLVGPVINNQERVRIDYTYLLLTGVNKVEWIGQIKGSEMIGQLTVNSNHIQTVTDWFVFYQQDQGFELKITYKDIFIYVPTSAKHGQQWWTPWDTPNFKKNLNDLELNSFGNLEWFPKENLNELKNRSEKKLLVFRQGTKEEEKLIKENWSRE